MLELMREGGTTASTGAVRAAPESVLRGVPLAPSGDEHRLCGDLVSGPGLTAAPIGLDPTTSVHTPAVPGERHADRTASGDPVLALRQDLRPDGGAVVDTAVEIDETEADRVGPRPGPQVGGDLPAVTDAPLAAARCGTHA